MPTNHSLDIQQRLLLPKRFLEHLLSPADSSDSPFWALHIGGTPDSGCVESNHKQRIITLDRTPCVADDHIRADETNLPFASKVFESVIAVDFLEQVPPGNRSRFLAETARVSCGWLLINGPFRSPALEQAEQSVNDLHRVILGRPNDLLESHWQYGLPELAETREELEKLGFASAVVPNGSLFNWFILKSFEMLFYTLPPLLITISIRSANCISGFGIPPITAVPPTVILFWPIVTLIRSSI